MRRPELASADLGAIASQIIAGQVDVFPAQWQQILQQRVIDSMAVAAQSVRRPFQIDGVIDTGTPSRRFLFHVMASLAEMERELIVERIHTGLDVTRQLR